MTSRRAGLLLLAAALATGAFARIAVARYEDGIFWPDEIYQSLEPGHVAAFGYGFSAWEFREGARHWTLPWIVAGVMKAAAWTGHGQPREYLMWVRLFFCAVSVLTIWAVYVLAKALGAKTWASAVGASVAALMGFAVYLGPRAMSETASAPLVALGLAYGACAGGARWKTVLGACLLGLATLVRLQSGFYAAGLLILLVVQKRRREALEAAVVLAAWALLFGLVDRLTWGSWFHSALVYLRFNVIEGKSGQYGRAPVYYYLRVLWTSMGLLFPLLVGFVALSYKKAKGVLAMPVLFFVVHSLIVHKELRFLFPALMLFCALAAVGLQVLMERGRPKEWMPAGAALIAAAGYTLWTVPELTFGRLGLYEVSPGKRLVMDDCGPENRLLLKAHDRADLCGIFVGTRQLAWVGGYAYLHRKVPIYELGQEKPDDDRYNYVIAELGKKPGEVVAVDRGIALIRVSNSPCRADPDFGWHLN